MQRSKLVLGFVVALAVGGLGAAAVAAEADTGGAGSVDGSTTTTTTTTAAPSTTTSTTPVPTTTVAPAVDPAAPTSDVTSDPAGDSGGGVARSTDGCDGGTYANHGDYVSSVAHDPNRAPGDVPAAAQSDCGKPLGAIGDHSTDAPETETPESEAPAEPSAPGAGHGNAYGHTK